MKAYRMMMDALSGDITDISVDGASLVGVIALFDGTELTEDVLRSSTDIDSTELMRACSDVFEWYIDVNRDRNVTEQAQKVEKPIISLYRSLLDKHLPSELDKQDPKLLYDVIFAEKAAEVTKFDVPEGYKDYFD